MKINVKLTLTRECYILCRLFQCSIGDVLVYHMRQAAGPVKKQKTKKAYKVKSEC